MISQVCIGDPTDEYVMRCGDEHWRNSKSVELSERISRMKARGKPYAFTARLRSFLIRCDHETLVKVMLAWKRTGPFYDDAVLAAIKEIMSE